MKTPPLASSQIGSAFKLFQKSGRQGFFRDIIITSLIGAISGFFSYFFNIIAANKLPSESFAALSAVLGMLYLVSIPSLSLQTYFTKKSAGLAAVSRQAVIREAKRYLLFGLFGFILMQIFIPFIAPFISVEPRHLFPLSVLIMGMLLSPVMRGILLGLKRVDFHNFLTIIESALRLGIFLFFLQISTDAIWPIWAFVFPTILAGFMAFFSLVRTGAETETVSTTLKDEKFGYFMVTLLTFFLFNGYISLDLVLVNPDFRASYAALSLIGKIVFFGIALSASVVFSYFASSLDRKTKRKYLYIGTLLNLAVGALLVLAFLKYGNQIHEIMFGENYLEIKPFMIPIAISMTFYSLAYLFINYFLSDSRRGHLYYLVMLFVAQLLLYQLNNSTLADVVFNQVVLYTSVSICTLAYLVYSESRYKVQ